MPVKPYTLQVVDRVGNRIADLPDAQLDSVKWELNGPGEIVYTMANSDERVTAPVIDVNEVALYVPQYEDPLQWAYHQKAKGSGSGGTTQFSCPGILEYFDHLAVLNTSYEWDDTEQMAIAANIVTAAQAGNATRHIAVAPYTNSGVIRSRIYDRADHKWFGDLLKEFPGLTDADGNPTGFDIGMTHPGAQRLFTMWYPTRGSIRLDIVLEWGRNISDYTVDEDGSALTTRTYCTGGSDGDIKFENYYEDFAAETTYGEWHAVISDTSENDVNVLLTRAAKYTKANNQPKLAPALQAIEVPDALLGVIWPGDSIVVRLKDGRYDFNSLYRISSLTWKPGPGNMQIGFVQS
jgi:hypothetical protein